MGKWTVGVYFFSVWCASAGGVVEVGREDEGEEHLLFWVNGFGFGV